MELQELKIEFRQVYLSSITGDLYFFEYALVFDSLFTQAAEFRYHLLTGPVNKRILGVHKKCTLYKFDVV